MLESIYERVEALYRRDRTRLWRALLGFAGDRAVADDAISEAFAQLLRRGEAVVDPAAWVWRSAFRIASGELSRRGRLQEIVNEPAAEDPEPGWIVVEALRALSDQQRLVVILRDYVGHSTKATAEIIDSTEQSVRVQLMRARRALRKELAQ